MQYGQGITQEKPDLVLKTNRGMSIFRDHQVKGRIKPGGLGQGKRIGTAHQAAPGHAAAIRPRYRWRQQGIHVRVGLYFFHNPLRENRPAGHSAVSQELSIGGSIPRLTCHILVQPIRPARSKTPASILPRCHIKLIVAIGWKNNRPSTYFVSRRVLFILAARIGFLDIQTAEPTR